MSCWNSEFANYRWWSRCPAHLLSNSPGTAVSSVTLSVPSKALFGPSQEEPLGSPEPAHFPASSLPHPHGFLGPGPCLVLPLLSPDFLLRR